MARKKSFGFGKAKQPPKEAAPRHIGFEHSLCAAIANRHLVKLLYEDDSFARTFAPHAVYHSTTDKVCVSGTQISNPADPNDRMKPRNFEIGLITRLVVTDESFVPDSRFDPSDDQYRNGIICRV